MKKPGIYTILRLIRWPNLLIIALSMVLVQYCILLPSISISRPECSTTFLLSIIYTVFIAAGGYILNDIRDVETDLINKPEKTIVSVYISPAGALTGYFILTSSGILLSVVTAFLSDTLWPFLIAAVAALFLYGYAVYWKKSFLTGNLIVSFLCALTIYQPYILHAFQPFSEPVSFATKGIVFLHVYAILAFISTLFREIIKDVQDMEGDRYSRAGTLPVLWGIRSTKQILFVVSILIVLLCIGLLAWQWLTGNYTFVLLFSVFNLIPFWYLIYKLHRAEVPGDFRNISYLALFHILTGTLSAILIDL